MSATYIELALTRPKEAVMSDELADLDTAETVTRLSAIFGIDWDPEVMRYEEPKIFKTADSFPPVGGSRDDAQ